MSSAAETGYADVIKSFSQGIGDIGMTQSFKIMMGRKLLPLTGLSGARRINLWILFATQFGTLAVMPGDEGLEDHEDNELL